MRGRLTGRRVDGVGGNGRTRTYVCSYVSCLLLEAFMGKDRYTYTIFVD